MFEALAWLGCARVPSAVARPGTRPVAPRRLRAAAVPAIASWRRIISQQALPGQVWLRLVRVALAPAAAVLTLTLAAAPAHAAPRIDFAGQAFNILAPGEAGGLPITPCRHIDDMSFNGSSSIEA